jgi:hypothetical protein
MALFGALRLGRSQYETRRANRDVVRFHPGSDVRWFAASVSFVFEN